MTLADLLSRIAQAPWWLAWAFTPTLVALAVWLLRSAWLSRKHPSRRTTQSHDTRPTNPARKPSLGPSRSSPPHPSPTPHATPRMPQRARLRLRPFRGRRFVSAEERAFDALAKRCNLDRRTKRLVRRLASAIEAKPAAVLLSDAALVRASAMLDDPPRGSDIEPLTLDDRRRLLALVGAADAPASESHRPEHTS